MSVLCDFIPSQKKDFRLENYKMFSGFVISIFFFFEGALKYRNIRGLLEQLTAVRLKTHSVTDTYELKTKHEGNDTNKC